MAHLKKGDLMAAKNVYNSVAYGLSDALLNVFPAPIVGLRAPTTADKAQIGTVWVNKSINDVWVLTSITNNSANWLGIGGGAGSFTNIVASGSITAASNITSTGGNINASTGSVNVTQGNITVTAGSITATVGEIVAGGLMECATLTATGDLGGTALSTSFTGVVDAVQSTGTLSIKSSSANAGTNAGFLKCYVGTTVVWVPYFTNIAP
jgi:hypothetical protein